MATRQVGEQTIVVGEPGESTEAPSSAVGLSRPRRASRKRLPFRGWANKRAEATAADENNVEAVRPPRPDRPRLGQPPAAPVAEAAPPKPAPPDSPPAKPAAQPKPTSPPEEDKKPDKA